jgi:glucose dehydrogenase
MRRFVEIAAVAATSGVVIAAHSAAQPSAEPRRIATAPAFDARQLTSHPTRDWITNGGNVFNQRYSPLTLLDRDNVKDLKALWRTSMGTGAAQNNSGQAQILHHAGALRHQRRERRVRARRRHRRDPLDVSR